MMTNAAIDTIDVTILLKRAAFILGRTFIPIKKPIIAVGKRIAVLVNRSTVTIPRNEKALTLAIPMKRK
jgi:hypothetical protein